MEIHFRSGFLEKVRLKCYCKQNFLHGNSFQKKIIIQLSSTQRGAAMYEKTVVVRNKAGIHCRPSSVIILAAQEYPDHEFQIETSNGTCGLSGILDLLALGIQQGDSVKIKVTGPSEKECCEKLANLFEHEFDFK